MLVLKTQVFILCLDAIKKDKIFFKTLNKEKKERLKFTIKAIKMINKELENILEPIAEGLLS